MAVRLIWDIYFIITFHNVFDNLTNACSKWGNSDVFLYKYKEGNILSIVNNKALNESTEITLYYDTNNKLIRV